MFDVGGGTTDFTLIEVDADGAGFTRTAVGDHLLLGGDNLDLTLAKLVEQRVVARAGKKLDTLQWHGLVHACRLAKETLLAADGPAVAPIEVQSRGARLIGGALRDEITRAELAGVLEDGFFPARRRRRPARARPRRPAGVRAAVRGRPRGDAAPRELPRAPRLAARRRRAVQRRRDDAGVAARARARPARPVAGTARRASCRRRCPSWPSRRAPRTTASCAAGSRRASRAGRRARSTSASRAARRGASWRSCLAPAGLEDGARVELARDFRLVTNRPVSFRLYSSSSRADAPGALVPIGDGRAETIEDGSDLLELPPIVTVLRARGRGEVTVRIAVHITELGYALDIYCRDAEPTGETWKLAFDMRSGGVAPTAGDGRRGGRAPCPHGRSKGAARGRVHRRRGRAAGRRPRTSRPCSRRGATSGRC